MLKHSYYLQMLTIARLAVANWSCTNVAERARTTPRTVPLTPMIGSHAFAPLKEHHTVFDEAQQLELGYRLKTQHVAFEIATPPILYGRPPFTVQGLC
jgi:hypothetical protein